MAEEETQQGAGGASEPEAGPAGKKAVTKKATKKKTARKTAKKKVAKKRVQKKKVAAAAASSLAERGGPGATGEKAESMPPAEAAAGAKSSVDEAAADEVTKISQAAVPPEPERPALRAERRRWRRLVDLVASLLVLAIFAGLTIGVIMYFRAVIYAPPPTRDRPATSVAKERKSSTTLSATRQQVVVESASPRQPVIPSAAQPHDPVSSGGVGAPGAEKPSRPVSRESEEQAPATGVASAPGATSSGITNVAKSGASAASPSPAGSEEQVSVAGQPEPRPERAAPGIPPGQAVPAPDKGAATSAPPERQPGGATPAKPSRPAAPTAPARRWPGWGQPWQGYPPGWGYPGGGRAPGWGTPYRQVPYPPSQGYPVY